MINKLKSLFSKDNISTPVGKGVVAGITEIAYITLVAIFMVATETLFATSQPWVMIFGIIAFLSLLILSIAISAVVVFVWPLQYFLEGKYKEARYCFLSVAGTIFVIFTIIFLVAIISMLF